MLSATSPRYASCNLSECDQPLEMCCKVWDNLPQPGLDVDWVAEHFKILRFNSFPRTNVQAETVYPLYDLSAQAQIVFDVFVHFVIATFNSLVFALKERQLTNPNNFSMKM